MIWQSCELNKAHVSFPDYEVVALAEVFNVSCEYLLGLTDAPAK